MAIPDPNPSPKRRTPAEKAEARKLDAETKRIEQEIPLLRKQHRLELFKTLGAIATALAGLIMVYLTFQSQQRTFLSQQKTLEAQQTQLKQLSAQARDESFLKLAEQFGTQSIPVARLSAAAGLEHFLGKGYEAYHARVSQLFVRTIEMEDDQRIRSFIHGALARNPSRLTLKTLREQNLQLQQVLATEHLNISINEVSHWEQPFLDTLIDSSLVRNLVWNVQTLMASLNRWAELRPGKLVVDLDLSQTILSCVRVDVPEDSGFLPKPWGIVQPLEGLKFKNVDLSGAKLSWLRFTDCTFENTRMDSAVLTGTTFRRCTFRGRTRLREIRWWLARENWFRSSPVVFDSSVFDAEALTPSHGTYALAQMNCSKSELRRSQGNISCGRYGTEVYPYFVFRGTHPPKGKFENSVTLIGRRSRPGEWKAIAKQQGSRRSSETR